MRVSLIEFIKDNPAIDIAVIVILISLITVIIAQQRIIGAKREIKASHLQVAALSRRVYIDALTSVKNKGGFDEYLKIAQKWIDSGEQIEFAIIIMDCDDLKQVNDQYGHDKGDEYIKAASRLICHIFKHSPVFRIGGDEFAVILLNEDYRDRKELTAQFEKVAEESCTASDNKWEQVCISMGMAEYDLKTDTSVGDVIRRADRTMYENKRARKETHIVR